MTTVSQVIEAIRYELVGGLRHEQNRLDGAILANATSLTVEFDAGGIQQGAMIAIDDELFHVWSTTGKVATVTGAQFGTTAANHADNAIVEVSPIASRGIIRQAMIEEIRSWPASLYGTVSEAVTLNTSSHTHLATLSTTGVRRILDVREYRTASALSNYETWPQIKSWSLVRGLTGTGTFDLQIASARGADVWVLVGRDFVTSTFTDATDLETTVGLASSMLDILRWGVLMRLTPARELARARTDVQGQPRNASEVPVQANSQVAIVYKTLRDQRIAEEAMRLRESYPETIG